MGGHTQLQISDAHVALQQVIHFLGGPFFKLILLAEPKGKYTGVSGNLGMFTLRVRRYKLCESTSSHADGLLFITYLNVI